MTSNWIMPYNLLLLYKFLSNVGEHLVFTVDVLIQKLLKMLLASTDAFQNDVNAQRTYR
jgi:hypothetical protein